MTTISGAAVALTGAGDGIGRALANALAARGADLALADIDGAKLAEVAEGIRGRHNVRVTTHVVDVGDRAAVQRFAGEAIAQHPKLNVLINNAGVALMGRFDESTAADFDWLMAINFGGVVSATRAFLPHLARQPSAHIVNLSSVFGIVAPPGQTAYAAAKFAVRGFTEALRHELAGTSVRVSTVHPGGIATGIAGHARRSASISAERQAEAVQRFSTIAKTTPDAAAERIIRGLEGNEPRILIGRDARMIDLIQRAMPVRSLPVLQRLSGAPAQGQSGGGRRFISWQAMALNLMLRFRMKRGARLPIDIAKARALAGTAPPEALAVPAGWRVDPLTTEGGLVFDVARRDGPAPASAPLVMLYLHGGGYFFGSPQTHRQVLIALSKALDVPAYSLDYRLAPEHPFPAAVEDALAAYRWILACHPGARIVVAGDSAGGGLSIATAVGIREAGLPAPLGLVLFSPWTDLAATGASLETNKRSCVMFTPRSIRDAAAVYLAGTDARDPRASPLYADLKGLPPLAIYASQHELLLDDSSRLAERARAAGVSVHFVTEPRMPHVWPVFVRLLPEARATVDDVARFVAGLKMPSARLPVTA